MKGFVCYWIEFHIDHYEMGKDTDNYLSEIRTWWSGSGKHWERQPNRFEIYTGGTQDAIGKYSNIENLVRDVISGDFSDNKTMGVWIKKFANRKTLRIENGMTEVHWGVDSGNIQRDFDFDDEIKMPKDTEFKNLWKKARRDWKK